jgi:5-hydroxyisourate hydrolase
MMMMTMEEEATSTLSVHVLDVAFGRPARGIDVTLERVTDERMLIIGGSTTNAEGHISSLTTQTTFGPGFYRLRFDSEGYFAATGRETFYPEIVIHFRVGAATAHYHVQLLVSPFGYSTSWER